MTILLSLFWKTSLLISPSLLSLGLSCQSAYLLLSFCGLCWRQLFLCENNIIESCDIWDHPCDLCKEFLGKTVDLGTPARVWAVVRDDGLAFTSVVAVWSVALQRWDDPSSLGLLSNLSSLIA
jgi:hypothetical protein